MSHPQNPPVEAPPSYTEAVRRAKRARHRNSGGTVTVIVPTSTAIDNERTPLLASTINVGPSEGTESPNSSHSHTLRTYFDPLIRLEYWRPVFHLLVLNFPFALFVWLYLFLGVLVGTTLLLTLPLGALLWWLTLFGSRSFANAEISMQQKFHGVSNPHPPHPTFRRPPTEFDLESGAPIEPTFLQNTYAMFLDWEGSYLPIFHFLVIKASIVLVLTPLLLAIIPVGMALIIPAPLVLRFVRKLGLWQANIALEGLA